MVTHLTKAPEVQDDPRPTPTSAPMVTLSREMLISLTPSELMFDSSQVMEGTADMLY